MEDYGKYYGPSTKFKSTPAFGRAAAVCELENIECRLDPIANMIHFASIKEEEKFMIAWGKIVAGSLEAAAGSRNAKSR